MSAAGLEFHPLIGIPEVTAGSDVGALLIDALRAAEIEPAAGDVVAIAQKIISKAEGRLVRLRDVVASDRAAELASRTDKDPRLVQLILQESTDVVRIGRNVIITEHKLGLILANAGIDRSNVTGDDDAVLLLPESPDTSAARIRDQLERAYGVRVGVIVTDSIGRPWRLGTVGTAIGCASVDALRDLRGQRDRFGRVLQVSEVAIADSLAGAAVLVMGEAAEGVPAVLIRGAAAGTSRQTARDVLRPRGEDLFR